MRGSDLTYDELAAAADRLRGTEPDPELKAILNPDDAEDLDDWEEEEGERDIEAEKLEVQQLINGAIAQHGRRGAHRSKHARSDDSGLNYHTTKQSPAKKKAIGRARNKQARKAKKANR